MRLLITTGTMMLALVAFLPIDTMAAKGGGGGGGGGSGGSHPSGSMSSHPSSGSMNFHPSGGGGQSSGGSMKWNPSGGSMSGTGSHNKDWHWDGHNWNHGWNGGWYPGYGGSAYPGYGVYAVPSDTYAVQRPVENVLPGVNFSGAPIVILNPATSRAALSYTLNGTAYRIQPGEKQDLREDRAWLIEFSRGGNFGQARYGLQSGVYTFGAGQQGWELYRQPLPASSNENPPPPSPGVPENPLP